VWIELVLTPTARKPRTLSRTDPNPRDLIAFEVVGEWGSGQVVSLASRIIRQGVYNSNGYSAGSQTTGNGPLRDDRSVNLNIKTLLRHAVQVRRWHTGSNAKVAREQELSCARTQWAQ
jgi:hypothetical protein